MRHIASAADRLKGQSGRYVLVLAATMAVSLLTAQVAQASVLTAINDCSLVNGTANPAKVFVYTVFNFANYYKYPLLFVGVVAGFLGATVGRGHKGWQIAIAGLILIIVLTAFGNPETFFGTCVPKANL